MLNFSAAELGKLDKWLGGHGDNGVVTQLQRRSGEKGTDQLNRRKRANIARKKAAARVARWKRRHRAKWRCYIRKWMRAKRSVSKAQSTIQVGSVT